MRNNKGFTLIELLATIIIISLVAGFTTFTILKIIDNANEKTYQTTINNIEKIATIYIKENSDRITFIDNGNSQYQCIEIKSLIDAGYFDSEVLKSKISKNQTVTLDMYIYVTRDLTTKTITETKFIYDESIENICN